MSKALCFLQITAEHQDCAFFTVFLTIKTLSQNISMTLLQISLKLHGHRDRYWKKKSSRKRFWKNSSQCLELLLQLKQVIASFRCYDNSDAIATLIITNFHLFLIQLWWQFFQIFAYRDVVYAQAWEVLTLTNLSHLLRDLKFGVLDFPGVSDFQCSMKKTNYYAYLIAVIVTLLVYFFGFVWFLFCFVLFQRFRFVPFVEFQSPLLISTLSDAHQPEVMRPLF